MRRLVILGGGTAGTMIANKLRHRLDRSGVEHHRRRPRRRAPLPAGLPVPARSAATPASRWSGRGTRSSPTASTSCSARSTGSTPERERRTPRGRPSAAPTTTWSSPPARRPRPDQTPGMLGPGVAAQHLRLLHPRGRRGARRGARPVRRRPAGRAHHRDADQVPGGAAGVHLPRRGLAARARAPRPGRAGLRDPAGRGVHQAGRLGAPRRHARRAQDRTSRPTSWSSGSTPSGRCSSPTTSARSPSTCW